MSQYEYESDPSYEEEEQQTYEGGAQPRRQAPTHKSDPILEEGISSGALKRMASFANGLKRMTAGRESALRSQIARTLDEWARKAALVATHARRKTVKVEDVAYVAKLYQQAAENDTDPTIPNIHRCVKRAVPTDREPCVFLPKITIERAIRDKVEMRWSPAAILLIHFNLEKLLVARLRVEKKQQRPTKPEKPAKPTPKSKSKHVYFKDS
jgi:histone H3/H4